MTLDEIKKAAAVLNTEEMNELRSFINEKIKHLAYVNVRTFRVGDKVKFTSGKRGLMTGKVKKINRKNIHVATDNTVWNVPAGMLSFDE